MLASPRQPGPGPRLAPFYDLLWPRAYPRLDQRLAMKVGGGDDPTLVSRRHWELLAQETGLRPAFVLDTAAELAHRLPDALRRAGKRFRESYGASPALELTLPRIARQARRVLRQLERP